MKYNIGKSKAPEMPNLGKGTECVKILLSQASKDLFYPRFRCFSRSLRTHEQRGISLFRLHLEGILWKKGSSGGRKWG